MTASIDGIVSGLGTSDLIAQLMRVERQPQVQLQRKRDTAQKVLDAYRSLNTRFSAIRDAAKALGTATGWELAKATSSDAARVSAQATAGAKPGSITFTVDQLAAAAASVSSGTVSSTGDAVTTSATVFVTKGATTTEVSVGDGSLASVVSGINTAKIGVTATAVQVEPGKYKLQLESTTTGADTDISVDDGAGGNPFASSTLGSVGQLRAGADAKLQVGGPSGYTVTRSSNTISDLLAGVTMTLTKADPATSVTVDVAADAEGLADRVGKLVDTLNAALGEMKSTTAYNAETKKGGVLLGESLVRRLRGDLVLAATDEVPGAALNSPSAAGLSVKADGTLGFDRAKFLDAYAKDPGAVEDVVGSGTGSAAGMAARVAALAQGAVDAGTGLLPSAVEGRQSEVRSLDRRIAEMDVRLADREQRLRLHFNSMEAALGRLRQQGDWLAAQLTRL